VVHVGLAQGDDDWRHDPHHDHSQQHHHRHNDGAPSSSSSSSSMFVRVPRSDGLQSDFDLVARGALQGGVVGKHETPLLTALLQVNGGSHDEGGGGGDGGPASHRFAHGWARFQALEHELSRYYYDGGAGDGADAEESKKKMRCLPSDVFLGPLELMHCFQVSGIVLHQSEFQDLVLGLGCDELGRVDGAEVGVNKCEGGWVGGWVCGVCGLWGGVGGGGGGGAPPPRGGWGDGWMGGALRPMGLLSIHLSHSYFLIFLFVFL
jgi:hypothetical protein